MTPPSHPPAPGGAELPPVDPASYRQAIGRFATGVTIATTLSGSPDTPGRPLRDHAMTANSITSISLDPVLLLISAEIDGRWGDAAAESGVWAISVLSAQQRGIAEWLSIPGRPAFGQLDRVPHHRGPATGVALIDQALATFECRTRDIHAAGDHNLIVGEVLSVHTRQESEPALVHYRGRMGTLT